MRKMTLSLIAGLGLLGVAFAETCEKPEVPALDLEPEQISRQDMVGLFRSVKIFQAKVANYRDCLEAQADELGKETVTKLHNASIDEEEAVAENWNRIFGAFKERTKDAR